MSNIPDEVKAAVEHLNADPAIPQSDLEVGQLLGFKVYTDRVVVIIPTGQKYTVSVADLFQRLKARVAGKSKPPENTLSQ